MTQAQLFAEPIAPWLRIDCGDAVAWLESLPRESVDLVLMDPAYESLEKHRAHGTTTRLTKAWFEIFPNSRLPDLLRACHRVLKSDAHCYIVCDQETMHVLHALNEQLDLFTWWKFIVWDKISIGMGYHWRARHEVVCFLEKGKRKLNDLAAPDVLSFKAIRGGYATEKPVPLLRAIIENSSSPGDVVCDPFSGSGSCAEAALLSGRRFAGCDLSEDAVRKAIERCTPLIPKGS